MKGLARILCTIVLLCAITPCADELMGNANAGQASIDVQKEKDSGAHEHGEDLCSPFCSCHCCHKHSLVDEAPIVQEGQFVRLFGERLITPPEEPLFEDPNPPRFRRSLV